MTELAVNKERVSVWKLRLLGIVGMGMAFVGTASAAIDLSAISDLIDQVVLIIPGMIDLVVGVAPIIVVGALIGFIVLFFDKILAMIKMR